MVDAPKPVIPDNQGKKYKVSVFMSPDHSIEPLADFVQSAKKSIDMYIPEFISWTYSENGPRLPLDWKEEANPLFQALANVGTKMLPVRIITNGPQTPNIPGSCDMWEWLLLQNAKINFSLPEIASIGGILIILDEGERILLTSMNTSAASFIYNRESSIILETPCDDIVKLFTDTFNSDFEKSIPFLPTNEIITNSKPPLIDPVSLAMIKSYEFKITSVPQPPQALLDSSQPYVTEIMEVDDVEFTLAMAGPKDVEMQILQAINVFSYAQIAIRSLPYSKMANAILRTFKQTSSTSLNLSYTLVSQQEANESDANVLQMYTAGMNYRLFRGPVYNLKPQTKDYYTHNGQAYMQVDDIIYFMTGNFSDKDLNQKRNFYIAFTSNTLSEKMRIMYSKDQLYASLWNPTKKTAVGEELKYKPES